MSAPGPGSQLRLALDAALVERLVAAGGIVVASRNPYWQEITPYRATTHP